jgi:hypothetical protein
VPAAAALRKLSVPTCAAPPARYPLHQSGAQQRSADMMQTQRLAGASQQRAARPSARSSRSSSDGPRRAVVVRAAAGADAAEPLLVRAARGEAVDRAPCWMMRQAGRCAAGLWWAPTERPASRFAQGVMRGRCTRLGAPYAVLFIHVDAARAQQNDNNKPLRSRPGSPFARMTNTCAATTDVRPRPSPTSTRTRV